MQPLIRRDCNYSNLDHIRKHAKWDDDQQEWILPPVSVSETKIPAMAHIDDGGKPKKVTLSLEAIICRPVKSLLSMH